MFVERRRLSETVVIELERPSAMNPRISGFWRGGEFYRVLVVAERRFERAAAFYRVVTDRGAFDLRRVRTASRRTMRSRVRWELLAELDVHDAGGA